ncbi:MAG: hypothetical protein ACXWF1_07860 [Chthoniobacterales bacterium]
MKKNAQRRHIFVFTAEEKKAAACVIAALLLGLATKHYRDTHPRPSPQLSQRQQYAAQRAAKTAAARARSARGRATASRAPATSPTDDPADED